MKTTKKILFATIIVMFSCKNEEIPLLNIRKVGAIGWKEKEACVIIYSDNNADMYESNLMRRLSGLLYIEDKIIGEIKEKIKSRLSK